jgi:hypothetical protein
VEDHQIKMLSDADLKSEHSAAIRRRNNALADKLAAEIAKREQNRPK